MPTPTGPTLSHLLSIEASSGREPPLSAVDKTDQTGVVLPMPGERVRWN